MTEYFKISKAWLRGKIYNHFISSAQSPDDLADAMLEGKEPIEPLNRANVKELIDKHMTVDGLSVAHGMGTSKDNPAPICLYNKKQVDDFISDILKLTPQPIEPLNRDNVEQTIRDFDVQFKNHNRVKFISKILSLSPQPIKPSKDNIDIVVGEARILSNKLIDIFNELSAHPFKFMDYKVLFNTFAHNLLSKLHIEYATSKKIREIATDVLKKGLNRNEKDIINCPPDEDGDIYIAQIKGLVIMLVKELSQLAKPEQGDKK